MEEQMIVATSKALEYIQYLKTKYGQIIFHQSMGCCNGTAPICLQEGDLILGEDDIQIGTIGGCPYYMDKRQLDYLQHTKMIVDIVKGKSGVFSLEATDEMMFIIK